MGTQTMDKIFKNIKVNNNEGVRVRLFMCGQIKNKGAKFLLLHFNGIYKVVTDTTLEVQVSQNLQAFSGAELVQI